MSLTPFDILDSLRSESELSALVHLSEISGYSLRECKHIYKMWIAKEEDRLTEIINKSIEDWDA